MKIRLIIIILINIILFSCTGNKQEKLFEFLKSDNLLEIKKLFIENCFELDTIDNFGYSPLGYAVKNQNIEMVKFLIEKGASVNYFRTYYSSPFYLALNNKQKDRLMDSAGYDSSSKEEIIKLIVANGLIIDKNSDNGKSWLILILRCCDF